MTNKKNQHFSSLFFRTIIPFTLVTILISSDTIASNPSVESYMRDNKDINLFTRAMDISNYWERIAALAPLTLFIPTDDAMRAEGSDFLLEAVLLVEENRKRLEAMLDAHIIAGASKVVQKNNSTLHLTLSGDCLQITKNAGKRTVGSNARILSEVILGETLIMTVDKLLIPDYEPSGDCLLLHDSKNETKQ